MELTPIKIRGKRTQTPGSKRGRGRPSKSASTSVASSAVSSRASTPASATSKAPSRLTRSATAKRRKTTKSLSYLEQLPPELLQQIFMESMNVSLPRSSPHIAAKLSDKHIYLDLSLRAFFCGGLLMNTTEWNVRTVQSQLLACRFFTWSFCQRLKDKASEWWHEEKDMWISKHKRICSRMFCSHIGLEILGRTGPELYRFFQWTDCRIPEKVLHGPWTSEKIDFLAFLCRRGARVDWAYTSAGEVATQGLKDAIREHSLRAARFLLANAVGVQPSTQMLRFAVMECGCRTNMIWTLLLAARHDDVPPDAIDYHDRELWAWAERAEKQGNSKGYWLRKRLTHQEDSDTDLGSDWEEIHAAEEAARATLKRKV